MNPLATRKPRLFDIYLWPTIIVSMLLLTIFAGVRTLLVAIESSVDLVDAHPYEKGVTYDQTLKELATGRDLAVIDRIDLLPATGKTVITIHFNAESPSLPSNILVGMSRPNDAEQDQRFIIHNPNHDAVVSSDELPLQKGLWLVEVSFEINGQQALHRERLYLR